MSSLSSSLVTSETKAAVTASSDKLYVLMGTTGKVGGTALKYLKEAKANVRAVLRDATKSAAVLAAGATSIAIGDFKIGGEEALSRAFSGADAIFIMCPIGMDPNPDFANEQKAIDSMVTGILGAVPRPKRVVMLSTIAAHSLIKSVLYSCHLLEETLRTRVAPTIPCVFVRPGGFFENVMWELPQAQSPSGVVHSYWTIDRACEHVASVDIGAIVAQELLSTSFDNIFDGIKIIELEGPAKYCPLDYARILSKLLGKQITYVNNPYDAWEAQFRGMGMKNPQFRMAMMHNFNQGLMGFEGGSKVVHVRGTTTLEDGLRDILAKLGHNQSAVVSFTDYVTK